jgi:purine nucleosidase
MTMSTSRATRIMGIVLAALIAFLAAGAARSASAQQPHRVIIDTDPGTDDAMAILLALNSPEIRIEALTIVAGNVAAPKGLENALKIVSLAGRCDIPVAKGAERPLFSKLVVDRFWNGTNALGGAELPPSRCTPDAHFGPDLIIELVHKYPHEITLIPIGPETNIALAVRKDPSIVPLVKDVVLMGGSISGGNITAAAEFNVYCDPEAASVVFNAGWPITMVGLDVTEVTLINSTHVAELERNAGPQAKFAAALGRFQIKLYEGTGFNGGAIHDALAVGAAIDPSFLKTRALRVDVETTGQFARGETIANRHGTVDIIAANGDVLETVGVNPVKPNVNVAVGIDHERFLKFLVSRLQGK